MNNQERMQAQKSLASESTDAGCIVEQACELYKEGGRAVPKGHADLAVRILMGHPPENRKRLLDYVKWAFSTGLWNDPSKTKSLYNLIRDGDWDVDISPRTMPAPSKRSKLDEALDAL